MRLVVYYLDSYILKKDTTEAGLKPTPPVLWYFEVTMRTIITILLLISTCYAECPKYQRVSKGETVPCNGAFFNNDAEQKLANDRAKLERDLELTQLQVQNRDQKAIIWEQEAKRQSDLRESMDWDFKKGMVVGVAGTILLFFATSAAMKAAR